MKIIDAHAHIFPDKIAQKATNAISKFYSNTPMKYSGTAEELLRVGGKAGVFKYLVFSTATTQMQVKSINDFIISEAALHQEFIPAGTMHIDFADFEEEIERIYEKGVKGIKFHPDFQRFNFDDERLYPIYDLLQKKDMFVVTHSGDYRHGFSHPVRVANIARKFPKLRIVAAHCGGWSQWELARECLVLKNVYVDTSSSMGFSDNSVLLKAIEAYGKEKIFFGTDFPMWEYDEELPRIYSLNLKDELLERILYKNFADFFGLK